MVTRLKDIANDLGLSVVTVSKVLRDHPDIRGETRKRVLKRMRELNYQPNLAARALVTGRTWNLGLVVPDLLHPFFAVIAKAISTEARKHGYSLLISSSDEDPDLEAQAIDQLLARRVDAILVASVQSSVDSFRRMEESKTPYILIDRRIPGLDAGFVGVDDEAVGVLATSHLIEQGCRRIAHIRGPEVSTAAGRLKGFLRALKLRHLKLVEGHVVSLGASGDHRGEKGGYQAARKLLATDPRPDGIFCFNDPSALGAMRAILDAGLHIPEDIAVVGCGNLSYSDFLRVPLSSVDQGSEEIGRRAADLALKLAGKAGRLKTKIEIISPRMVVRASSRRRGKEASHGNVKAKVKMRSETRRGLLFVLALGAAAGTAQAQQNRVAIARASQTGGVSQAASVPAVAAQQDQGGPIFVARPDGVQESGPTIRVITRRVVVDVLVTGPDGRAVKGLTEQDFKVFEDGKPQPVRAFEVHSPEEDRSLLPPAPSQLASDTFINLEPTPASGPVVVVLLDKLNTPVTDQAYAHEQIIRFLEAKAPSTEVAIFALGDDLSLLQGFTTDSGKLLAAMHSKAAGLRMPAASDGVRKAQITLDAFAAIGKFLAAMDGRKNLLWFSESFDMMTLPNAQDVAQGAMVVGYEQQNSPTGPATGGTMASATPTPITAGDSQPSHENGNMVVLREQLRRVAIALAVSQTAVYPIDVRGLVADPGFSAANEGPTGLSTDPQGRLGTAGMPTAPGSSPAAVQQHNDFIQSLEGAHATMAEIADATGGHAFVNSNGLAAAAEQAVNDGASYYTLVYAPTNLNFNGGLRAIHVALDKPGYKLTYRSAYYAVDPSTVTPTSAESDRLAAAMVHGAPEAQGLIFRAQIDRAGGSVAASPDSPMAVKAAAQTGKKKMAAGRLSGMVQGYQIRLAILAQQLELAESPDGRHHAQLEIEVCAYAPDGRKLGGMKQNLEAAMPPVVYAQALENGMFHNLRVELPVEASSMRLAIFDPANHRTGSLEVALPLPSSAPSSADATPKAVAVQR